MVACGGGGGDSSAGGGTPAGGTPVSVKTGVLIDEIVVGMPYKAAPSGKSGVTNSKGEFEFEAGDPARRYHRAPARAPEPEAPHYTDSRPADRQIKCLSVKDH